MPRRLPSRCRGGSVRCGRAAWLVPRPNAMIGRDFFRRDPRVCAAELIGCELVWRECAGIVVETEAYSTVGDEACHTFARKGAREFVANHPPGTAYVYLNYGMHWLLNVLIKTKGEQGFVLFRALQPSRGIELMKRRRGVGELASLCSGPGKLTQALGIRGADHGLDLCATAGIGFRQQSQPAEVACCTRIGISKAADLRWRFLARASAFVSVPARELKPQKKARP